MKLRVPTIHREATAAAEALALVAHPLWRGEGVPRGDGMPVLLIPGFLVGDSSLRLLAKWLERIGYAPERSGIASNVACSSALVRRLERRLETIAREHRSRVAIVGHSRGGTLAKVLAQRNPHLVSGVVALGTPFLDPFQIDPVVAAAIFATGALGTVGVPGVFGVSCLVGSCCREFWQHYRDPLDRGVPFVSVYSRRDGIVDWRACLDPSAEPIAIDSTHLGMAASVASFRVLGDRLARFARERRKLERIDRSGRSRRATVRSVAGRSRAAGASVAFDHEHGGAANAAGT